MTVAENLQAVVDAKSAIKAAIERKGQDMSGVPFTVYAAKIDAITGGGGASYEEMPLTITENGVISTPEGVRYTEITTAVPKPQLNQPSIEFNANGGYIYIIDGKNGNFSDGYELYLNGEKNTTLTGTSFLMQDIGATETDEIGIVAVGDLFNNSEMATARWSDLELGTIGLEYNGNIWKGLGTATADEIYVASIVNGVVITTANYVGGFKNKTIHFANSITMVESSFAVTSNDTTFVLGASCEKINSLAFNTSKRIVVDFRKVLEIPTIGQNAFYSISDSALVVRDEWYDEFVLLTNVVAVAKFVVKASIYEAQQGGTAQ